MATKATTAPDYAFSKDGRRRKALNGDPLINDAGEKLCRKCGEYLPLVRFQRRNGSIDGRHNACKDCCKPRYWERKGVSFQEPSRLRKLRDTALRTVTEAERLAVGDRLNLRVVRMVGDRRAWEIGNIVGRREDELLVLFDERTPLGGLFTNPQYLVPVADWSTLAEMTPAWERQWWKEQEDFEKHMRGLIGKRG